MIEKYDLEDLILAELRKQPSVSSDARMKHIGLVKISGVLDLGRLAETLWDQLPFKSVLPPR